MHQKKCDIGSGAMYKFVGVEEKYVLVKKQSAKKQV